MAKTLQVSITDVRGQRICPVRTFFGQGGSSDADVRTLWFQKLRIFWKIYGVSTRTRGEFEPVRTNFLTRGRGVRASADKFSDKGVNFLRFCADVLYGRPHIIKVSGKLKTLKLNISNAKSKFTKNWIHFFLLLIIYPVSMSHVLS